MAYAHDTVPTSTGASFLMRLSRVPPQTSTSVAFLTVAFGGLLLLLVHAQAGEHITALHAMSPYLFFVIAAFPLANLAALAVGKGRINSQARTEQAYATMASLLGHFLTIDGEMDSNSTATLHLPNGVLSYQKHAFPRVILLTDEPDHRARVDTALRLAADATFASAWDRYAFLHAHRYAAPRRTLGITAPSAHARLSAMALIARTSTHPKDF